MTHDELTEIAKQLGFDIGSASSEIYPPVGGIRKELMQLVEIVIEKEAQKSCKTCEKTQTS